MKFLMRCVETKNIVGLVDCAEDMLFNVVDKQSSPFDLEYLLIPGKGMKWISDVIPVVGGWFTFKIKGGSRLRIVTVMVDD